ncbi:rubredoxin [Methanobrevibacter sp. TMH8]|uniref:thiamine pyrophosphate-dependent enzyme n=1 Tax=Methanobrevibacter sp. TMH8 TaxID=2848611 RepID=UPI001CC98A87|nr:thiamine pyrophosphate-dependent enzyme [Methanobrevibacter sp. TMH8]MBZ9570755.1 rubredoxin [Methanobrevibacter sp. TMH8]
MAKYRCKVCNYFYDESREEKNFDGLDNNWICPVCNASKEMFIKIEGINEIAEKSSENVDRNNNEETKEIDENNKNNKNNESNEINKNNENVENDVSSEDYKTVSDVLVEQMVAWGIKYVFGLPGTSSLGVVDSVRKNKDIEYFQVRHEQTAAMMASAYGKLTGNIAACLTIAGPGATNLTTGLYDAKLDKSPVLAITGYVKRELIGTKAFQEINQQEFFEPFSVFNKTITHPDETTRLTTLAIRHALLEKGVSHISISADIQKERCDDKILDIDGRIATLSYSAPITVIDEAVKLINAAKRPVIVAGWGTLENKEDIKELSEKISAPITTSFKGKGVIDDDYDLYVGSHGNIGTLASGNLTNSSDLLIIIGCSCSNNTNLPNRPAIQIDVDPLVIGKKYPIDLSIIGNSGEIIPKIIEKVEKSDKKEYLEEIKHLKQQWNRILEKEEDPSKFPLKYPFIMKELSDYADDDAIIAIDVGENGWRVGRNFPMKNTQELIMSGYLATMGYGLPAALASQIVNPEKQVICITGDGGFAMVMGDFLTAVKYKLPVKVFVFNNHELGMIMTEQKNENYPNWNTHLHNCDFAEFARSCGAVGLNAGSYQDLKMAIENAFAVDGPVIVDIETDPNSFD